MDASSEYGSWPMQTNANPDWQYMSNGMPVPHSSTMPSGGAPVLSFSSTSSASPGTMASAPLYPHYLGAEHEYTQYQQLHGLSGQYPASSSMQGSVGYSSESPAINAAQLRSLQMSYPNATREQLIDAVLHTSQPSQVPQAPIQYQQQQQQHQQMMMTQPQPHQQQPQHQYPTFDMNAISTGQTLADALAFKTPATVPATSMPTQPPVANATTRPIQSDADVKKKSKMRQTKLAYLPGLSHSVSKAVQPSPPAASTASTSSVGAAADADEVPDNVSEPGTPPLPPAKALAAKPKSTSSSSVTKAAAYVAPSPDTLLWNRIKPTLTRLSVEREPGNSARTLITILSKLDSDGRFLDPIPTSPEVRGDVLAVLQSIATLERGKGFTETGRKRYLGAWIGSPAGRRILARWLRQATPPKNATESDKELSRRYKRTMLPLLAVLDNAPMTLAYLNDAQAKLASAMTGASLRALDLSARTMAMDIKNKWLTLIQSEDSTAASSATPASTSTSASSSSTSTLPSIKRKPVEGAGASETSTKRYKTATPAASASSSARTVKATPASTASSSAKPNLPFFASSSVRKPVASAPSRAGSSSVASRGNAGQDVMTLLNTLSGGTCSNSTTANRVMQEEQTIAAAPVERVTKRVRWKDDSELRAILYIEPADYGQDDTQHAEVMERGLGGLEHDEGEALRHSYSTMEEQMDWHEPKQVIVFKNEDTRSPGSDSVEGPFQAQRNASLAEVVYEDGQEPESPDESQLEQEGAISKLGEDEWPIKDLPEEMEGQTTLEILGPMSWEGGDASDGMDGYEEVDEKPGHREGGEAAASGSGPTTSSNGFATPNISELLSKLGPLAGLNGGAVPAAAASSSASPLPNFDANSLKSLLERTNGSSAGTEAVKAAVASSDGLSSLLSSLSSSIRSPQPPYGQDNGADMGNSWQRSYRENSAGTNRREESYPGEYQQDYTRGGGGGDSYQHQQSSQYGDSSSQYGGYGGWNSQSNRGGGGGGDGGGAWQSRLHTKPCKFYAQGNCFRGASCHFRHD